MVRSCCICPTGGQSVGMEPPTKLPLFAVPKIPELFEKWSEKIPRTKTGRKLRPNEYVCSRHFLPDQIDDSNQIIIQGVLNIMEKDRCNLKKGAVPCLNLPTHPFDLKGTKETYVKIAKKPMHHITNTLSGDVDNIEKTNSDADELITNALSGDVDNSEKNSTKHNGDADEMITNTLSGDADNSEKTNSDADESITNALSGDVDNSEKTNSDADELITNALSGDVDNSEKNSNITTVPGTFVLNTTNPPPAYYAIVHSDNLLPLADPKNIAEVYGALLHYAKHPQPSAPKDTAVPYTSLIKYAESIALPSPLWGVHKDPEQTFVIFSCVESDSKEVEKTVLFKESATPLVTLRRKNAEFKFHDKEIKSLVELQNYLMTLDQKRICCGNQETPEHVPLFDANCNGFVLEGESDDPDQCSYCAQIQHPEKIKRKRSLFPLRNWRLKKRIKLLENQILGMK